MATGQSEDWSLGRLLRYFLGLRQTRKSERPIVFNSTNLAWPGLSVLLQELSGTRWCLDLHDDLLYDTRGIARLRAALSQQMLVARSDVMVHAAPSLGTLFPRSHHIGNGSSLEALPKTLEDPSRVLVLASLDSRFDFPLMTETAAACPDRQFEIHGRVSQDDPATREALDRLIVTAANVSYHGPYTDVALPTLLANYLVAFAPYRVGVRVTDYIDPLRFYHCLLSRTGLVSTGIPAAADMAGRIEVVSCAKEVDAALDRAITGRGGPARTWRDVAGRVAELLESVPH
jgi:hypothetical protein